MSKKSVPSVYDEICHYLLDFGFKREQLNELLKTDSGASVLLELIKKDKQILVTEFDGEHRVLDSDIGFWLHVFEGPKEKCAELLFSAMEQGLEAYRKLRNTYGFSQLTRSSPRGFLSMHSVLVPQAAGSASEGSALESDGSEEGERDYRDYRLDVLRSQLIRKGSEGNGERVSKLV